MLRTATGMLVFAGSVLAATSVFAGAPAQSACALLTDDVLRQHSPMKGNRQMLDILIGMAPEEQKVGTAGSSCERANINLQLDPFGSPATVEKSLATSGSAVRGLGDVAYYRDNGGRWGELYVRAGKRVMTLQVSIPDGKSAAAIQPDVVALARVLLPKLD